ncbi:MAG: ABC transporter ATP-binding protein [Desulfuromonas sp.]|nr:MAG: ABC transporter ATP-binding protein [Desulfuromonas sp.]
MITFENVRLQLPQQVLFAAVNLDLAAGDKLVLRGASGSGKSSLLKCVVGAFPLSAGRIAVAGQELTATTVATIRARIAYIGQEPVLGAESVREALLLPFRFKAHSGRRPLDKEVVALLERLHLSPNILEKPCNRISGGEKQRIAVARALLLDKQIFIADEITSALDPESKEAVMAELFRPEITLLSVSHDPDWIAACTRIIELTDGQLREEGR